jgi:acetoacetyl-CoA synthetase
VKPGDRVAAYLPNIPETMVAFLATVSIGAVWSVCAPDMGTNAVLDRFRQIDPVVLIACDGVTYGGRDFDRLGVVAEMRAALPTLRHVILHRNLGHAGDDKSSDLIADYYPFALGIARNDAKVAAFEPLWLPFDHPLWIVYSSGTTGLPKPIVHGHGGTVIVALALKIIHNDVGCSYHPNNWGERYHWYSSTGWVMWNAQTSGLLNGTTCVIYDGNPGGSKERPDWTTLWRFAAETGRHLLRRRRGLLCQLPEGRRGTSPNAATCPGCARWAPPARRCRPRRSSGARPSLPRSCENRSPERYLVVQHQRRHRFRGAFIGGHRELPQVPGEMQCRLMGCAVEAWNDAGEPVLGEVGELVCAQPIPSMPLYFVGDKDNARLLSSYFEMYPPGHGRKPGGGDLGPPAGGVWRHGDWLRVGAPRQHRLRDLRAQRRHHQPPRPAHGHQ